MSTSSAIESVDARRAVLQTIAAARLRVRATLLVRAASVSVPVAVAVGSAVAIMGQAGPSMPLAFGIAGIVGAAAWGARHTPSMAETASRLDSRLGLRDRLAAALQLHADAGPVASLVVRDAATRLARVRVADLFPFTLHRASSVAIPVALALTTWLAWGGAPAPALTSAGRATAGTQAAGAAGTPTGRPAAVRESLEGATSTRTDTARAGTRADSPSPEAPRAARDAGRPGSPGISPDGVRAAAGTPGSAGLSGAGTDPIGGTSGPPPDAGPSAASGAAAGSTAARQTAGAGGVSQGEALAPTADSAWPGHDAPARYAAARKAAEASLTRDTIPPDYRDDVRAYFRAIAPGGSR